MSYGELNALADKIADHLVACGVRRGDRVALWLEKSAASVAALFGTLKADACYVPIDPKAPVLRAKGLLETTTPAALVASPRNAEALRGAGIAMPSCLITVHDASRLEFAPSSEKNGASPANAKNGNPVAYILFTSGSTGTPKGVTISNDAAMSFASWAAERFRLTVGDVVSSHAPLHFDLSTFDIFSSVMAGATIALVPARESLFPASLGKWIAASGINVWYSVPSILINMVDRGGLAANAFPALRAILFAGEVMPAKYLRPLMALAPNARLFNLYGPTETNVCTFHEVEKDPVETAPIPIGSACPYCDVRALDDNLAPVRTGEAGELYVGGASLMDGYWQMPEETNRRLIVDPGNAGRKLYKTGDMARIDDAGIIHFIGRRDRQIKLHGYRIEPAEIEAALDRYPDVGSSAVLAVEVRQGQELVAFIRSHTSARLDRAALLEHCARHLPPHMIPRRFVFVAEFPVTSTGKLDRNKLLETLSSSQVDRETSHAR